VAKGIIGHFPFELCRYAINRAMMMGIEMENEKWKMTDDQ
jgi:hypothetical protein